MNAIRIVRSLRLLELAAAILIFAGVAAAQDQSTQGTYPNYPSETPAKFEPTNYGYQYTKREEMIPMRDGVRLHTVILIPKGAKHAGILLTRTPYDAGGNADKLQSTMMGPMLEGGDNATDVIVESGYIRVIQDVRGKYGSEGDYVMNRPLHGPQNPTPVDHSTDTYDTIDWLVKNIPESNGKVGIIGISYDGFLPLMALVNPHPALKVSVPMNPMVDGWRDDWFHNGAFREEMMSYIYDQQATRKNDITWATSNYDDYDTFLEAGSAGELGRQRGMDQLGFWKKLLEHPAYDAFWSDQALDRILVDQPLKVPMMLVASQWDQEDNYGANQVYKTLKPKDTDNDKVFFVLGPWHHGQEISDSSSLGPVHFDQDTGKQFREEILKPFLAQYLQDDAPKSGLTSVTAFETGTNTWRHLQSWPLACDKGCKGSSTPLYLTAEMQATFAAPKSGAAYDEYVSDPAKPVTYRTRPIQSIYLQGSTWSQWLVDDQRPASARPDVLSYETEVLTQPVKIAGEPVVNLYASTSGTDSDWVVKVIDVYPDQVADQPAMGGYQLMISADIFRGRYRESTSSPKAIEANKPLLYKFSLPTANHVFRPGHRIMVQIQSTWFPLYDRNPQTFVSNIFLAKPEDFKKAVQRVYHEQGQQSFVSLPVVSGSAAATR